MRRVERQDADVGQAAEVLERQPDAERQSLFPEEEPKALQAEFSRKRDRKIVLCSRKRDRTNSTFDRKSSRKNGLARRGGVRTPPRRSTTSATPTMPTNCARKAEGERCARNRDRPIPHAAPKVRRATFGGGSSMSSISSALSTAALRGKPPPRSGRSTTSTTPTMPTNPARKAEGERCVRNGGPPHDEPRPEGSSFASGAGSSRLSISSASSIGRASWEAAPAVRPVDDIDDADDADESRTKGRRGTVRPGWRAGTRH